MKPGSRTLGIAESYSTDTSTLAGIVMSPSHYVDGFVFGACTVGGTDLSDAVIDMVDRLDRDDVLSVMVAGDVLAWFNILDIERVANATDRPVVAVTFEDSEGLEPAIEEAFEEPERSDRLDRYRTLPTRHRVSIADQSMFVRTGRCPIGDATELLEAFTDQAQPRPEPLRVAKLAAGAVDDLRTANAL